ncbi:hypothetical protein HDU98_009428 [Podochytrium sp. JEL0797]|nr:hypothetical protein HDU98_009428 [Podochytrium sp. JEL0797]
MSTAPQPLRRTGATTYRNHMGHSRSKLRSTEKVDWWALFSLLVTCLCCDFCLGRNKSRREKLAWREKVALCVLFVLAWVLLALATVGLPLLLCNQAQALAPMFVLSQADHQTAPYQNSVKIYGYFYNISDVQTALAKRGISLTSDWLNVDITSLFEPASNACSQQPFNCVLPNLKFPASPPLGPKPGQPCPDFTWISTLVPIGIAYFSWLDLDASGQAFSSGNSPHALLLYNNAILNVTSALRTNATVLQQRDIMTLAVSTIGKDATLAFRSSQDAVGAIQCLQQSNIVGYIYAEPVGCAITHGIQIVCLLVIVSIVVVKVVMALVFLMTSGAQWSTRRSRGRGARLEEAGGIPERRVDTIFDGNEENNEPQEDPHVILFVTCYSESRESVAATIESLAASEYPDAKKLLFVVADGLVTGSGNPESTPEAVLSLLTFAPQWPSELSDPEAKSYASICEGAEQHNMAKVYAGFYEVNEDARVPMVVVVKCGTPAEMVERRKPGNRGKRDSQMILMHFLSRTLYNDRMTALEYDLHIKIAFVGGNNVTANIYTLVLMVDADTTVECKSLRWMVETMQRDEKVMGLCGETQIANKFASWVTMIQVFEYFLSHHLGKSFESSFGGVTCLPGCFSMFRIKMPKGPCGAWVVPVLVNPDIVEEYAETAVDSLHQKNLLLLGEDRFLTTLMLRTFPKRKLLDLIGTIVFPATLILLVVQVTLGITTGTFTVLPIFIMISILFLPGTLIAIASFQPIYILWMFVYFVSLPIWNIVLPVYAFWHLDDFSWGETRLVEGEIGVEKEEVIGVVRVEVGPTCGVVEMKK